MGIRATLEMMKFKMRDERNTRVKPKTHAYMTSQFFVQLVHLNQLMEGIKDFVGEQPVLTDVLFEGLNLCIYEAMESMSRDRYNHLHQKNAIEETLSEAGIKLLNAQFKSFYPRTLNFELSISKANKVLLNGELKQRLEALYREPLKISIQNSNEKQMKIAISSVKDFTVDHGVAYVGKNASIVTGDSYAFEHFQNNTTMLAISDGMGYGDQAYFESSSALKILRNLFTFGIQPEAAIKVLTELKEHSNGAERYLSLDLCFIDKGTSKAYFYKQAAATSFLIREAHVHRIEMPGLPIGAQIKEQHEPIEVNLQEGDLIVMCSDGILDAFPKLSAFEKELALLGDSKPQQMAQSLLDFVIGKKKGIVHDDMMITVARYKRMMKI